MVGLNGFFISSVQAYFFEGQKLREIEWSLPSVLCLLGYILTLFVMYNFTSVSDWLLIGEVIDTLLTSYYLKDFHESR
jgi:hypothetical protein